MVRSHADGPARCGVWVAGLLALAGLGSSGCSQPGASTEPLSGLEPDDPRAFHGGPREFRAAWVATVANIDWPSKPGLPAAVQRAELEAILDRAAWLGLNALIFQVRPMCDALYPSALEPWSEWLTGAQGRPPKPLWDPLEFAVAGAHARGLELHAWFNPYRARHAHAKSRPARNHVSQRLGGAVVTYGKQLWLDPGDDRAREHSLNVMLDVVRRYDIDGVHIDDYFYPYPEKGADFPDYGSYRRYRRAGGKLSRGDWRRANVDDFIQQIYRGIKALEPWVKFGISPFGIARPGVPAGIKAGVDQYDQLYADVRKWLAQGWCDYMSPQLYWPIAQKAQSYPVLLKWWVAQNTRGRHLWIGNYTSKTLGAKGWPVQELLDQVALTRRTAGATGNVHFSMKAMDHRGGKTGDVLRRRAYARPALVPASPWLDDVAPPKPQATARWAATALVLRWRPGIVVAAEDDVRRWAIYTRKRRGSWQLVRVLGPEQREYQLDLGGRIERASYDAVAVTAVDRSGNESRPCVVTLPAVKR